MNLIKPKKLKEGDTIAIIATSGEVDFEKIKQAVKYFENKNFKVVLGSNIQKLHNELAGTDEERLEDIHNAFLDKNINAIICARGGYGALRLVNKIDYSIIKNNPKIFCGYSDITILNAMFYKKCGLVTFSGPMVQSDFAKETNKFTEKSFWKALTSDCIEIKPRKENSQNFAPVQARLFGGNLSTLASLCGVDFIPDEKFIFFAEDVNEPTYKIDRYFTQLLNIEKFRNNVAAIVCGEFSGLDNLEYFKNLLDEIKSDLNVPIVTDYPISHSPQKATVPVGGWGELSSSSLKISDYLLED